MDKRELTYAKQTILGVKDWDSYQQAIRFYVRIIRPVAPGNSNVKEKI